MSQTITEQQSPDLAEHLQHDKPLKQQSVLMDWVVNNLISRLFFRRKFIIHRLNGLFFLLQYIYATYLYISNYDYFIQSPIVWTLPLTGLLQAIVAVYTFTFLPKKQTDPGYFGDKGVLSYAFIMENVFYEMILLFAWLYYSDRFFNRDNVLSLIVENVLVFFPYYIRTLFPKTRMRDSIEKSDRNKSEKNRFFFIVATYVTKAFYVWAKHYIGFFVNYARFMDRIGKEEQYHLYLMIITSSFATTVSIFLHTLKFKGYVGPVKAYLAYMVSYFFTFYSFIQIGYIFFDNFDLTLLVLAGLVINFTPKWMQHAYQMVLFVVFNSRRYGQIEPSIYLK